jgi:threonine/homoserine/homoserine lactone efflux protein
VLNNLANPKMAVFFSSMLPQFVPAGAATFGGLLGHGLAFSAMTLLWLAAYAWVVARAGRALQRSGPRRALEAITGAALAALGLRLLAERR